MKMNRFSIIFVISMLLLSCEFDKKEIVSKNKKTNQSDINIVVSLSYDVEKLTITGPKKESDIQNIAFTEKIELTPIVRREHVDMKLYKDGSIEAEIKELTPVKFKVPKDDYYQKPVLKTTYINGSKIEIRDENGNILSENNIKNPKSYKDIVDVLSKGIKGVLDGYKISYDNQYNKKSKKKDKNDKNTSGYKGIVFVKPLGGSVLRYEIIDNEKIDERYIYVVDTLRDLRIFHTVYKGDKLEYKEDYIYDDFKKTNPKLQAIQRETFFTSKISGVEMRTLEIEEYSKYVKIVNKI